MSFAIGAMLLLLVLSAMCVIPARPSIAIGLLITLYGVEQMLMAQLPFMAAYSALYNFTVGVAGSIAILSALYRFGTPRIPTAYLCVVGLFFLYTCISILWTDAPITGREWLAHFIAEVPLCVLIPIFTLRQYDDFKAPIRFVLAVSVLVSLTLLVNPASAFGGRTYLVGIATVLSPAEMTGAALVLLTALDRDVLGLFARVRIPTALLMATALYRSGARGQFLLAIVLPLLLYLSRRFTTGLSAAASTALAVIVAAAVGLGVVAFDTDLPTIQVEERYSAESMSESLRMRFEFIEESLTLDKPIFGHGVAGWSFMHNYSDVVSKLDRGRIMYPHNSLAHVYFELGLVGILLFVGLIAVALLQARILLRSIPRSHVASRLAGALLLYFLFSLGLSLKQNTYLAILGVYLSASMISVLMVIARQEFKGASIESRAHQRPHARPMGQHV